MSRAINSYAAAGLCVAIVIGAAFVASPAGASDVHQALQYFGITSCSSSTACIGGSNAGSGAGVQAAGTNGAGLTASSTKAAGIISTSGKNNGVRGDTHYKSFGQSSGFSGIVGFDDSTDGGMQNSGVFGSSTSGTGVRGNSSSGSAIYGASAVGMGVVGTTSGGANTAGVYGNDISNIGEIGVLGNSTSGVGVGGSSISGYGSQGYSQNSFGVTGLSQNSDGMAGFSINGAGVSGTSSNSLAISAISGTGNGTQSIQAIGGTSAPGGYSIATFNSSLSPTFVMDNGGNAHISGLIYTGGGCSSGCAKTKNGPSGRVERYMPQEAAPTMEDVGEAQLTNGEAHVRLDPAFANVVDTGAAYVVFVTPEGPSRGLYVTNKSASGFDVAENPGGHSTVAFSYRIVAKPYGVTAQRLPYVSASHLPTPVRNGTLPPKRIRSRQ
jgi:hypothetical protein